MDMRNILLVYTTYITIWTLATGSSCNVSCEECAGAGTDSFMDNEDHYPVTLVESYCFVNECIIRLDSSQVLLNIINNTGDRIIATNKTDLFVIFANDSSKENTTRNCSSDTTTSSFQSDTALYVIQIIIYLVALTAAGANVGLHLRIRELRTVPGILIIILCICSGSVLILDFAYISLIYFQIDIPANICAAYVYLGVICINLYEATKISVLVHFVYTMYRGYRLLEVQHSNRWWLIRYITFITGASAICSGSVIILDATVKRRGFDGSDERCVTLFASSDQDEIQISTINLLYFVILLVWLFLKAILFTAGLVFYFLTKRQCCITSTSRDFRVFIILVLTVDLNTVIFILLLLIHVSAMIFVFVLSTAAGIELVALLVLFASSSKVMCPWMQRRHNSNLSSM